MISRNIPQRRALADLTGPMPKHIAVIMDGNRRWARERNLPIIEGYRRGMTALRETTRACRDFGVPILTVYGFSEENWKRETSEISLLFELCCAFARTELDALRRENVRVRVIGRIEALPRAPRKALEELVLRTAGNSGTVLNIAVNYSARTEMCDAIKALANDVHAGTVTPDSIDDDTLASYLYTAGLPDPDLLIRPGGESRLSNFLLYQVAYTELWMTDVYWPEFSPAHFADAIAEFQRRQRRFGGA
ncbi:MAG: di-trans,poly-cis-decaprenylcistransferase [Candidatus Eremiobacter antarcticus]|nr:di-trans,poly-cis-decaprenylcistransferase [Candidatus Eremiobacteraeota bacterium]MBC5808107.1 di-trans,poly-cis-decaprenylcistransferase [Candidatus Eremiobacteraeota bacterium]PZR63508.1 MAG: di-trans,poly-cis-decaprenylcistransferase [Candidatus Eremiobacter sp. RRmetagenome_bin22]